MSSLLSRLSPFLPRPATWWLLVFGWCALIFALSHQPDLDSGLEHDLILRKAAHVIEYAILTVLVAMALRTSGKGPRRALAGAAIFAIAYAMSDELHQSFVPGRMGSPVDVVIDTIGVLLATLLLSRRHEFQPEGASS